MTTSSRPPSHLPMPGPFARRGGGLLLHPTSLPGGHGCGDLGPAAHAFVDFLAAAGQRHWQMLPICPPGAGNSPYDSPSASAMSETLLSLEALVETGLISLDELGISSLTEGQRHADFDAVHGLKSRAIALAHERFTSRASAGHRSEYEQFLADAPEWLEHHAQYMALKAAHGGRSWTDWDTELRDRKPQGMAKVQAEFAVQIDRHRFAQFELHRQWSRLHQHCRNRNVLLMGDIPIYVAYDSADVWAHREVFCLTKEGHREVVAGVPPDYFSAKGQLWGNPLYRWSHLQRSHYGWWVERLRTTLNRFDSVRLDHFIGFRRYWEVAATAETAEHGRYLDVPGERFFAAVLRATGSLPFLAEDLGVVTDEVHALRQRFNLPGMRILQFAFDDPNGSDYLPHRYVANTAVYTGTHDNDTTAGWFNALCQRQDSWAEGVRNRVIRYLDLEPNDVHWQFIRLALSSTANTAIIPVQDLLGLGSEARMNTPGTTEGNWVFRLRDGELSDAIGCRLRDLSATYERLPG